MKSSHLFLIFCLLFFSNSLFSQSYTVDREKFIKEFSEALSDLSNSDPKNFIKKELKLKLLETTEFPEDYFKRMVETCNLMESKKLKPYTEMYNYVFSVYSIVEFGHSSSSYKAWHSSVDQLLNSKNINRFKDFIELSADFFSKSIIADSPNHAWYYIGGSASFDVTNKPIMKFKDGKLICLVKNSNSETNRKKPYHDSIVIDGSTGVYDPFLKKYEGKGGILTWEKVGLDKTTNFANLYNYDVSMKTSNFNCDTVLYTTPYFTKPILGKLTDRAFIVTREVDRTFPYLLSYDKRLKIKNIKEEVDYEGGFSMQGASFVGVGTVKEPAILTIYYNFKPFVRLHSQLVTVDPKKIISPNSHVAIFIGKSDSITHPGLDIIYNFDQKALEFARGKVGTSSAPFSSSYHALDMFVPKILWKKGVENLLLTYDFGISQEQRIARFESKNLFDARLYERLQAMEKVHPLVAIAEFSKQSGESVLSEGKLASALNKTIEQAKMTILELNSLGFINYDGDAKKITVNQKLFNFVDARSNQIDYDNLQFISDMRPKKIENFKEEEIEKDATLSRVQAEYQKENEVRRNLPNFGVLDLNSLEIALEAVDQVSLSEPQNIVAFPKGSKVIVQKDRDFLFNGWMNTGKMEINTLDAQYVYAENKVKLNKTESSLFRVSPLTEKDGTRPIPMGSAVSGIQGEILVDSPSNRSGKSKTITDFPKLDVFNTVKVYYAQKSLHRGAYDSARFFFDVYPFAMDSLDNFKESAFRLKGELNSAGIFPIIKQELRIMPDYSFGFTQEAPKGGYDFYGTGAKYENKIVLSNNGLQGSGKIDFINSSSISKAFTFLPDSTIGYAVFDNKPAEVGVLFPDVVSKKAYICYLPKNKLLKAYSTDIPLSFFNDEAKLDGIALIRPNGMTGNGTMNLKNALVGSSLFKFTRWDMDADTSIFKIQNKLAGEDEKEERFSLATDNIKSHISFKEHVGNFKSNNGESVVDLPVNQYSTTTDKFDWMMQKEKVLFATYDKDLYKSNNENLVSNVFSTNHKQDSLQFRTAKAELDLTQNVFFCNDTKYIDVADARVYPDSGRVVIHKKAKMDPLNNSRIIANRITKYHTFYNANTVISSRKNFSSRGIYPYYDADSVKTMITVDNIYVDSNLHTLGYGKINEKDTFKFSKEFEYFGAFKISSPTRWLTFKGSTRIKHDCSNFSRSWMAFESEINPKNIQIPVVENMKTSSDQPISAGILWRDSPSLDSIKMYPTFLSPVVKISDPVVITSNGVLRFNRDSSEFQIAPEQFFIDTSFKANFISLNTKKCSLKGIGKVNLGLDLGDVSIDAYGTVLYDQESEKTKMNLSAKFNYPIDKGVMNMATEKIISEESLTSADLLTCNFLEALYIWSDKKTADKARSVYLDKAEFKKVPSELENSIVISGLKLISFNAKKSQEKGMISYDENAVLVSVFDKPVMKSFPIKVFLHQVYSENVSGDKVGLYLNAAVGKDYFYEFSMTKKDGEMKIFSEDEEFGNKINGLKADKRKYKNFSYEFTDNRIYISKFLRLFSNN